MWLLYVGIGLVAVLVILFVIGLFGKKKPVNESLISVMVGKIEVVMTMNKNEVVAKELESLLENVKFLYPSVKEEDIAKERKICNKIDDLKVMVGSGKREEVIVKEIDMIKVSVVARKAGV